MRFLLNVQLLEVTAAKVVPAFAGLGFVAVAARYCDPEDYGVFSLTFAMANLTSVVSAVWISQAVLRFAGIGDGVRSLRYIVAVAVTCSALLSSMIMGLSYINLWPMQQGVSGVTREMLALAVALSLNATVSAFAISLQKFKLYRRTEVSRSILLLLLVVAVAFWKGGASGLILAYATATLLPSLMLMQQLDATETVAKAEPLGATILRFIQYGWPMTIWAGLQASQSLIERNLLGAALPPTEFGRFMAAADVVVRGLGLALMPIVTVVHSRLMATAGHNSKLDSDGHKLIKGGLKLILIGGLALTILVLLARSLLSHIAPGIADINTATLLMLCASAILWGLALIVHKPLELARQTKRMSVLLAIAVVTQWALLSHLVGTWHEIAMPMASCIAAFLYMAGCIMTGRAKRNP